MKYQTALLSILLTVGLMHPSFADAPVVDGTPSPTDNSSAVTTSGYDDASNTSTPSAAAQNGADLLGRLNDLQEQVKQLQGQWETSQHQLKALQDSQKKFYADLDTRLQALESTPKKQPVTPHVVKSKKSKAKAAYSATPQDSASDVTDTPVRSKSPDPLIQEAPDTN